MRGGFLHFQRDAFIRRYEVYGLLCHFALEYITSGRVIAHPPNV
jgi:hypothetical protein